MNRRMTLRSNVYRLSLCAVLLAMMLILGFVESMIPLNAGVPGIKLGLSNGVLIFAVYMLDIPAAFILMSMKVLLSGVLFAGPSTMMYGFAGGLLSLACMSLLSRVPKLPVPAVSIVGGVMHNVGQVGLSIIILQVPPMSMLWYMLVLTGVGAVCGLLTGVCAKSVMAHLKHTPWRPKPGQRRKPTAMILAVVLALAVGAVCWYTSGISVKKEAEVTFSSDVAPVTGLPMMPRGN